MLYRKMPRSQDSLSILGLGLMRLPATSEGHIDEERSLEMLHHAVDNGVNYFDTAWVYYNGASEQLMGKFVDRVPRNKLLIATKSPCWLVKTASDLDKYLDQSLQRLRTDHIDYYLLHSLGQHSWNEMKKLKALDWLEKQKADGRIRHIGFSFHDKYPVFKKIAQYYDWDFCQFMLNYLDTHFQAGLSGYRLASSKGIGIIAMEPLRGGKLVQNIPPGVEAVWKKSAHAWTPVQRALNWIWNLEHCTVALSGMSSLEQLNENITLAKLSPTAKLSEKELTIYNQARLEYIRRIAVPCTECRYCMPCPHKVAIPGVFGIYNEAHIFNDRERHLKEYKGWIPEDSRADKCVNCGACVSKCPQHIPIPDRMKEVAKYFQED